MPKCLVCYQNLTADELDYHEACCRKLFGTVKPPVIETTQHLAEEVAYELLSKKIAVTGVQKKLSLHLDQRNGQRLTIVGALGGNYILKPQSDEYPELPENEDLTMNLAEIFGIKTALHGLVRLADGSIAYLTKRFDRQNKTKIPVEDFCQLTETLTEQKYRGSHEKIARAIEQFSSFPGDDKLRLFELVVLSFLTGNADMHLKNFSLWRTSKGAIQLSPAYDLLSTRLVLSAADDPEELALTLDGKKSKLSRDDFAAFSRRLEIPMNVFEKTLLRLTKVYPRMQNIVRQSHLTEELRISYLDLMEERLARLLRP